MQGTVHQFDDATGVGSVLLDDGRRIPFAAAVFEASGLRRLRVGQRLTIEVTDPVEGGTLTRLSIVPA
jgi:cold shock CspA family protein